VNSGIRDHGWKALKERYNNNYRDQIKLHKKIIAGLAPTEIGTRKPSRAKDRKRVDFKITSLVDPELESRARVYARGGSAPVFRGRIFQRRANTLINPKISRILYRAVRDGRLNVRPNLYGSDRGSLGNPKYTRFPARFYDKGEWSEILFAERKGGPSLTVWGMQEGGQGRPTSRGGRGVTMRKEQGPEGLNQREYGQKFSRRTPPHGNRKV